MTLFEFINALIESLAWPIVLIVALLMFRKEVRTLLGSLRSAKWGDRELEFRDRVQELRQAQVESEQGVIEDHADQKTAQFDRAYELLEHSTRGAILEAWLELEVAVREVYTTFIDLKPPSHVSIVRMARTLATERFLSIAEHKRLESLWQLRNEAVHNPDIKADVYTAQEYIDIARSLARVLRQRKADRAFEVGQE